APALHETCADHHLQLPNGVGDPERLFGGKRFLRHVAARSAETRLAEASGGLADARTLRLSSGESADIPAHDGELVFGFVVNGSGRLDFDQGHGLEAGDAFVIPPRKPWRVIA